MHSTDGPSTSNSIPKPASWVPIIGLFLLAAQLCDAAPTLTARIEPAEIRPGSTATYVLTIEGGAPDGITNITLPSGVEMSSSATTYRQQTSIINGVLTRSSVLGWQITSSTLGEHVIPPQEFHVGGMPFTTNEVKLVVKEDASSPSSQFEPQLSLEVGKTQFYIGEVVPITASLYVNQSTFLRRVGLIEIPKENFAIQRFPTQAEQSEIKIGGKSYTAYGFQSTLSGMKPGKFKLGPATSEIILDLPLSEGRFQNPIFGQFEQRKLNPQSNEIDVTVLPLPAEGKPKNFNGVVGDFQITMTADPRSLAVGDPVAVELTITGQGNFDALTAPEMTNAAQWKTYPSRRFNVGSSNNASVGPQTATFSQVIIPKQQVTAVPSFEISYFSPEKKKYVTLRTPPIPLEVKAAENPVEPPPLAAGTSSASGAANQPDKVPQARPKITDILTVASSSSPMILSLRPPLWKDRDFVLANITAAGALLLLLGGKFASVMMRNRVTASHALERKLWNQLQARSLPRGRFYELAASYIQTMQLAGSEIEPVLQNHHTLNYGRPSDESTAAIGEEERSKVLQALKTDGGI